MLLRGVTGLRLSLFLFMWLAVVGVWSLGQHGVRGYLGLIHIFLLFMAVGLFGIIYIYDTLASSTQSLLCLLSFALLIAFMIYWHPRYRL